MIDEREQIPDQQTKRARLLEPTSHRTTTKTEPQPRQTRRPNGPVTDHNQSSSPMASPPSIVYHRIQDFAEKNATTPKATDLNQAIQSKTKEMKQRTRQRRQRKLRHPPTTESLTNQNPPLKLPLKQKKTQTNNQTKNKTKIYTLPQLRREARPPGRSNRRNRRLGGGQGICRERKGIFKNLIYSQTFFQIYDQRIFLFVK